LPCSPHPLLLTFDDGRADSWTGVPDDLRGWLTQRYEAVFTQDESQHAYPGAPQPLGRIQVTRAVSGGDLHARMVDGK
jgi:hypothetical protein